MNSTLIKIGIIEIKWYSMMIFLGIVSALFLIIKEANKKNISKDYIYDLAFYTLIIGILGARLYYVIFNLAYYLQYPSEIIMIWNGGLAIHGGLIAALIYLTIKTKKDKKNLLLLLDIIVVGVIIAQSIGRWGNFFNQEAFGRITTLDNLKSLFIPKFVIKGMYIDGAYREPTFLYESILSFLGFITLIIVRKVKKIKTGQLTSLYLIWYGTSRLIIEKFRSDSLMLSNIKVAQLVSILMIICGIIVNIYSNRKNKMYNQDKLDISKQEAICTKK